MDLQVEKSALTQNTFKSASLSDRNLCNNLKVSLCVDYGNDCLVNSNRKHNTIIFDTYLTDPGCSITPLQSDISNSIKPGSTKLELSKRASNQHTQFNSVKVNRKFLTNYKLPNIDIKPLRHKLVKNDEIQVLPNKPISNSKLRPCLSKPKPEFAQVDIKVQEASSVPKTWTNEMKKGTSMELLREFVSDGSKHMQKSSTGRYQIGSTQIGNEMEFQPKLRYFKEFFNTSRSADCLTSAGNLNSVNISQTAQRRCINQGTPYDELLNENLSQIQQNLNLIKRDTFQKDEFLLQMDVPNSTKLKSKLSFSHDDLYRELSENKTFDNTPGVKPPAKDNSLTEKSLKSYLRRKKSLENEFLLTESNVKSHYDYSDKNERCRKWLQSLPSKFSNIHVIVPNSTYTDNSSQDLT